ANPEQVIYVINSSSEPIIVTSVRLMDCQNVQGSCSPVRFKTRVGSGSRAPVHRVRARYPDQAFSFRYTFTWEAERSEGPTAKDVAQDSTALVIDTLVVAPKLLELKVGEALDLSQALSMEARNAKGTVFPKVWFHTTIGSGAESVELQNSKVIG